MTDRSATIGGVTIAEGVISSPTLASATITTALQCNQVQAQQFRIENRTSDPSSPAVGEIWFRTDL